MGGMIETGGVCAAISCRAQYGELLAELLAAHGEVALRAHRGGARQHLVIHQARPSRTRARKKSKHPKSRIVGAE